MSAAIGFTGATIDRADRLRTDPAAFEAALVDESARLLAMDGLDPVRDGDDRLAWRPLPACPEPGELALLGLDAGRPRFVAIGHAVERRPADWEAILALPAHEAALYAAARSLVDWHARHRFCANCGTPTAPYRAGWGRRCPACEAEHFPRVDPVAIMLVEHRGADGLPRTLLARQARFPPGRYSVLAGFIEPGESLEEAVAREVLEEAGIAVTDVRYVASQPWPFPSNLMLACTARALGDRLVLDSAELEDGFWASAEEVAAAIAGEAGARFQAPPPHAIARTLLEHWLGTVR